MAGTNGSWKPTNFRYLTGSLTPDVPASATNPGLGGSVVNLTSGGNVNFGDVVQHTTTAFKVNKATTTLNLVCGVAVGGQLSQSSLPEVLTDSALVGVYKVAAAAQAILVQTTGIVMVAIDSASAVAAGDPIIPSAVTAGRVTKGIAALTIAAGATPVTSSAATAVVAGNATAIPIIGHALSAGTSAGDVIYILLQRG